MMAATKPNPNAGDTNMSIESATSIAPTPIVKARIEFALVFMS